MNDKEAMELVVRENLAISPIEVQAVEIAMDLGLSPEAVDYAMEDDYE